MASLPTTSAHFDGAPEDYKLDQDHKRAVDYKQKYALGIIEADSFRKARPAKPGLS
jgi:hypothetical protein